MRVLVCGGRHFDDIPLMCKALDELHAQHHIEVVIHGGASGADHLSGAWAKSRGLPGQGLVVEVYRADWGRHGRAAGPIRNQFMLDDGKPDLVVAFPGGRGTADMVRRARDAGVKVIEVENIHRTSVSKTCH